jgi:hypothetical protein
LFSVDKCVNAKSQAVNGKNSGSDRLKCMRTQKAHFTICADLGAQGGEFSNAWEFVVDSNSCPLAHMLLKVAATKLSPQQRLAKSPKPELGAKQRLSVFVTATDDDEKANPPRLRSFVDVCRCRGLGSTGIIRMSGENEALALRENLIAGIAPEAVGVWLSHNTGYDMSQLPDRFSLAELQQRIVAANAPPVGFVHLLAEKYGQLAGITRDEFFHHGLRAATGYDTTMAGSAVQVADQLEEVFEATGSRGGFMLFVSQAAPRAVMNNIVDLLVAELRRRGRYRDSYKGRTLRENLTC